MSFSWVFWIDICHQVSQFWRTSDSGMELSKRPMMVCKGPCLFMRLTIILGAAQQMCPGGAGAPGLSRLGTGAWQPWASQQQGNPQPFPGHSWTPEHLCTWWRRTSIDWGAFIPSILPLALKELQLASSKILVIPTDVFSELSELEKLDRRHNQITEKGIKEIAFGNMIKLENLNLAAYLLNGVTQNLHSSLKELRLDKRRRI